MKKHPATASRSHPKDTDERRRQKQAPSQSERADHSLAPLEVITIPSSASTEAPRSSAPEELRVVRFGYFQPDAREVYLVGSFNGWNPRATPMQRDSLGDWSVRLPLPAGEHRYRLMVDGAWCDDPAAPQTAMNPFGGFDAVINV